jgi:hypothetical protein
MASHRTTIHLQGLRIIPHYGIPISIDQRWHKLGAIVKRSYRLAGVTDGPLDNGERQEVDYSAS